MSRPAPPACKTRNWPGCNAALKRRGALTIWFDPAMMGEAKPTGRRGRQPVSRDVAVIPPRKTAKPWKADTAGAIARNEALRATRPCAHHGSEDLRDGPAAVA